jgi:L-fuconolactonase
MPELARDHTVAELGEELARNDVRAAILVQVLNDPVETDEYLWLATSRAIVGVVGWADLLDPGLPARLDHMSEHPSRSPLVGIRHQALAEPDPVAWLWRASAGAGFRELGDRGLVFDLMFRPEHLRAVGEVVGTHAGTSFVLDHAGKPPIDRGWESSEAQRWAGLVRDLARHDNLNCKLSGLTTMADLRHWRVADLGPFVDHLLSCFGADRLVFGSDWPVSLRAGSYAETFNAARTLIARLSADEQAGILGCNARRIYAIVRDGPAS